MFVLPGNTVPSLEGEGQEGVVSATRNGSCGEDPAHPPPFRGRGSTGDGVAIPRWQRLRAGSQPNAAASAHLQEPLHCLPVARLDCVTGDVPAGGDQLLAADPDLVDGAVVGGENPAVEEGVALAVGEGRVGGV